MNLVHESFARVWYVGVAMTPLLLVGLLWIRTRRRPDQRHAIGVALLASLVIPLLLPALREPGLWLTTAREELRSSGLAPCLAQAASYSPPQNACVTLRYAAPWAAGSAALLIWYAIGVVGLRRQMKRSRRASADVIREVERIANSLGVAPPQTRVVEDAHSPFVTAGRRPVLILPAPLLPNLNSEGLAAVVRHELAHLKRRDVRWLCLVRLSQIAFWWHPAVWLLGEDVLKSAELASDQIAVDGSLRRARSLAEALILTERSGSATRTLSPAPPVCSLSRAGRRLAERITAMMVTARVDQSGRHGVLAVLSVGLAVGFATIQVALG